jgi:hypothetical protein
MDLEHYLHCLVFTWSYLYHSGCTWSLYILQWLHLEPIYAHLESLGDIASRLVHYSHHCAEVPPALSLDPGVL